MLPYSNLFVWWAGTITAGILFLSSVSVVLYFLAKKREHVSQGGILRSLLFDAKRFAFVWVLLTLLVLYIVSIDGQNYTMFAIGNIVIEGFIFGYLVLTRKTYHP